MITTSEKFEIAKITEEIESAFSGGSASGRGVLNTTMSKKILFSDESEDTRTGNWLILENIDSSNGDAIQTIVDAHDCEAAEQKIVSDSKDISKRLSRLDRAAWLTLHSEICKIAPAFPNLQEFIALVKTKYDQIS